MTPVTLVNALVEVARQLEPFDRVSVGLPGIVHRGTVYALPVLGDHRVRGFRLAALLERKLDRPTRIMNGSAT